MNYADFYESSGYANFSYERREVGSIPLRLIRADQKAHSLSDPATSDIVLGLTLGGSASVRWRWESKWNSIASRNAGDIGISPYGVPLDFEVFGPHRLLVLAIPKAGIEKLLTEQGYVLPADFGQLQGHTYWRSSLVSRLCVEIWKAAEVRSPLSNLKADGCLQTLIAELSLLAKNRRTPNKLTQPKLSTQHERIIAEYVADHPNKKIKLEDFVQITNIPVRTLQRQFQATFGLSPYKYVLQQRIEQACILLKTSDISLANLAYQLGFCDQSHLTRTFVRMKGLTPAEYRKNKSATTTDVIYK